MWKTLRFSALVAVIGLFAGAALAQDELQATTTDTGTRTVQRVPPPVLFRKLSNTQSRCPFDVPVWLDPRAKSYLLPGQPGYAVGINAAYACKREADAFGAKPARK